MATLKTERVRVALPVDLISEIDEIVGKPGRTEFLVQTAREALRRKGLLKFLQSGEVIWKDRDHPELSRGSAAWVRKLRRESDLRNGRRSRMKK